MNMKQDLRQVTLIGVDGTGEDMASLDQVLLWCMENFDFHSVLHVSGGGVSASYNGITRVAVPRMSYLDYNKFCLYSLPNLVQSDYCMIVHADGFIVNPHLWEDEFLNYDYIGAPWYISDTEVLPWLSESPNIVGNGGFCIRSRKFLDFSKSFVGYDGTRNEDVFLCIDNYSKATEAGIRIADRDTAARFSVEILSGRYPSINNSFGFHGKHNLNTAVQLINSRKTR